MNANSCSHAARVVLVVFVGAAPGLGAAFKRGDANGDHTVNVSDAVRILRHVFQDTPIPCFDAADCNDDGHIDAADALGLLGHLFAGTSQPPEPFTRCGPDPTPDDLDCGVSNCHGTGVIFLIDLSANMGWLTPSGQSAFAVMKQEVIQTIEDLPEDSAVSVMLLDQPEDAVLGDPPLVLNEQNRTALADWVAGASRSSSAPHLFRSVRHALRLLRSVPISEACIILVSDGFFEGHDPEMLLAYIIAICKDALVTIHTVYAGPRSGDEWTCGRPFLERLAQRTGGTFRG